MKHIIFDLDGTLLDSMQAWKNIGRDCLRKKGIEPPENLREKMKNLTIPQAAQFFITEFSLPLSVEEMVEDIIQLVADKYKNEIQLKPFALEFLERQKQLGSKMCILTASEPSYIHGALERLGILPYFEFIMTCTQTGLSKHEPKVFHLAMEKLQGSLDNTLVIEDALYAVQSAKKAGLYVIAIEDETAMEDKQEILNICDCYVTSYEELM